MRFNPKEVIVLSSLLIIVALVLLFPNTFSLFTLILTILYIGAFYFFDKFSNFNFKESHYIIIITTTFFAIFIGGTFYFINGIFDKILHLTTPFFISFILFYMINKIKMSFQAKLLTTFTSMMTILILLEVVEYLLDILLGTKNQGVFLLQNGQFTETMSRIDDTMMDIICGFCSSLLFVLYKNMRR